MEREKREKIKLSIIIPIYNEEKFIEEIVKKIHNVDLPLEKEIIIVDDASTDNTSKIIENLKTRHQNIIFLQHKKNFGKGAAVRTGLKHFSGDMVVIQDADLEYNPEDFKKMAELILQGKTKVVYGSRFMHERYKKLFLFGKQKTPMPTHYIGNKFLSLATRILYYKKITDMETCYKMFTREVAKNLNLKSNKFNIEPEITAKIIKKKHKIIEIPIHYNSRSFKEGKKLTWKDGFIALYTLFKYRFSN